MWDILLATEGEAKKLSGSILTTKSVRFQTEYIGTRRTKITIHGVPVDISEDKAGAFFSHYRQVEEVSAVVSKASIATGDFVLQVTLTCQNFGVIPNVLMCRERRMLVMVEGRKPYLGYMAKACPGKSATRSSTTKTKPAQAKTTATAAVVAITKKAPDGDWKEVQRRGKTASSSSPQQHEASEARHPQTSPQKRPKEAQR